MTREQRRAGRAIRKARRLEAQARADLERQLDALIAFARRTFEAITRFFAAIGAAATAVAELFASIIPPNRKNSQLPPAGYPRPTLNHWRPR